MDKLPIFNSITGFNSYRTSLIELDEYAQLYDLDRKYKNLAKGIFDKLENKEFSKEYFIGCVNCTDDINFILENMYRGDEYTLDEWED